MMANQEWPRLLYHKQMAPGGWRIDSEKDRKALGPGWMDEPEKLDPPQVEAHSDSHSAPSRQAEIAPSAGPSKPARRTRKQKDHGGNEA